MLLESQAERSEGLELCRARAQALAQTISRWREAKDDSFVRWIELFGHSLQLHATPLSIASFGKSPVLTDLRKRLAQLASSAAPLLFRGERGSHPEPFARLLLQEAHGAFPGRTAKIFTVQ